MHINTSEMNNVCACVCVCVCLCVYVQFRIDQTDDTWKCQSVYLGVVTQSPDTVTLPDWSMYPPSAVVVNHNVVRANGAKVRVEHTHKHTHTNTHASTHTHTHTQTHTKCRNSSVMQHLRVTSWAKMKMKCVALFRPRDVFTLFRRQLVSRSGWEYYVQALLYLWVCAT